MNGDGSVKAAQVTVAHLVGVRISSVTLLLNSCSELKRNDKNESKVFRILG